MRTWGPGQPDPRQIPARELRDSGPLELISYDPSQPPPPPATIRLFAGLDEPLEAPYAGLGADDTGSAGLWRALESL